MMVVERAELRSDMLEFIVACRQYLSGLLLVPISDFKDFLQSNDPRLLNTILNHYMMISRDDWNTNGGCTLNGSICIHNSLHRDLKIVHFWPFKDPFQISKVFRFQPTVLSLDIEYIHEGCNWKSRQILRQSTDYYLPISDRLTACDWEFLNLMRISQFATNYSKNRSFGRLKKRGL